MVDHVVRRDDLEHHDPHPGCLPVHRASTGMERLPHHSSDIPIDSRRVTHVHRGGYLQFHSPVVRPRQEAELEGVPLGGVRAIGRRDG